MQEAIALRREGIKKPILVLGYTLPEMIKEASGKNISITISNFESLSAVIKFDEKINIHIKVDTGMFRHGFFENEVQEVLKKIKNNKKIVIEGLFTNFSMAKDPCFPNQTICQIERFKRCKCAFLEAGYSPICHASATSGILLLKEAGFDMVRFGIGLYGIWPSEELQICLDNSPEKILTDGKSEIFRALDNSSNVSVKTLTGKFHLKPILSWKTIVVEVKKIPKGARVGYDGTGNVRKDSILAVLPIGYWHGYPRVLSNLGYVLINGKKAKILGRVCMDITMVDVTDIGNVKVGDEVTIIGQSKKAEITADEIAKLLDASTYELLTRINPLIKRFYI